MQRVLTLTADDKSRFTLLWQGFLVGANVERTKEQGKGQSRDDRKSEARIKRALQAASEPVVDPDDPEPKKDAFEVDRRPRTLLADGATVALDQPDFARLQRYVTQTPWLVDLVEQVSELEDWMEAAPQQKDA